MMHSSSRHPTELTPLARQPCHISLSYTAGVCLRLHLQRYRFRWPVTHHDSSSDPPHPGALDVDADSHKKTLGLSFHVCAGCETPLLTVHHLLHSGMACIGCRSHPPALFGESSRFRCHVLLSTGGSLISVSQHGQLTPPDERLQLFKEAADPSGSRASIGAVC